MSLRDQLAGKRPRRITVRVQVTDPGADGAAVLAARTAFMLAELDPERAGELPGLREIADRAQAAADAHFADVEFVALPAAGFELLLSAHTDRKGDVDRDQMRAALAAACAVDEDLRDEAWWAEQFASGQWSRGELDAIYQRLFVELNYSVPSAAVPKG